ncbi:MAG TPA: hypothetical protein VGA77_07755 [Propylenella sp.]
MRMRGMRLPAVLAMLLATGHAQAADLPGRIAVPAPLEIDTACADPAVLDRIMARFAWAERNTWRRGFVMASLDNPRLSGHPYVEPGIIERQYCMADSPMTNGDIRTVYYAIEFGVGFASIGNYVDFCVLGLDPWHVHDGACRTVR